jgi:hypothetical protein
MVPTDNSLGAYPPELIARFAEQAAGDADMTIHFLGLVGLTPSPGETLELPRDFLLELGAAMRLLSWERDGLVVHESGLPTGRDAFLQAFSSLLDTIQDLSSPAPASSLHRDVFRVTFERLAWVGPRDLHAEIVLDLPDEDALVEAMARFLWDRRRAPVAEVGSEAS